MAQQAMQPRPMPPQEHDFVMRHGRNMLPPLAELTNCQIPGCTNPSKYFCYTMQSRMPETVNCDRQICQEHSITTAHNDAKFGFVSKHEAKRQIKRWKCIACPDCTAANVSAKKEQNAEDQKVVIPLLFLVICLALFPFSLFFMPCVYCRYKKKMAAQAAAKG